MIIERSFCPVTITFESKEEVQFLHFMVGLCKETTKATMEVNFREMLRLIEKNL